MTCATCDLGLLHCHAIVVRHDDGAFTCPEGCGGPLAVHDDVLDCADVVSGCCEERRPSVAPSRMPRAA